MSVIDGVSEIFDLVEWDDVFGFEDLIDFIYYWVCVYGIVCIVFDWFDVFNVFCLYMVDELLWVFEYVCMMSDVGVVLFIGNGLSEKNGKWVFCIGRD